MEISTQNWDRQTKTTYNRTMTLTLKDYLVRILKRHDNKIDCIKLLRALSDKQLTILAAKIVYEVVSGTFDPDCYSGYGTLFVMDYEYLMGGDIKFLITHYGLVDHD